MARKKPPPRGPRRKRRAPPRKASVPPAAAAPIVIPARINAVCLSIVVLAIVIAFAPSINNEFVHWDDYDNYVQNAHIRSLSAESIRWMMTSNMLGVWQPLTWFATACEYAVFGGDGDQQAFRAGMQYVSIGLHMLCAIFCYFLAARLLALANRPLAERSPIALGIVSGLATLFFAIHPIRVETVAWASGQPYLIAAAPAMACVLCYLRAARTDRKRWHAAAVGCLALSLVCKSIAVPMVAVLCVLDAYPLQRIGGEAGWSWPAARNLIAEKIPYALLTMASVGLAVWATASTKTYSADPPLVKAFIVSFCLAFYVVLTFVPVGIAPYYSRPQPITSITSDPLFIAALLGVVAVAVAAFILRRRAPWLGAACLTYALFVAPVAGIVRHGGQLAADRYTYLSCIPWAVLVGGLLLVIWHRGANLAVAQRIRAVLIVVGIAAFLLLGRQARAHCRNWSDSITLWTAMIERNPDWRMGRYNLAKRYKARGDLVTAERLYREAIDMYKFYPEANVDLGNMLQARREYDDAMKHYRAALRGRKNFHMALYNMGRLYIARGDPKTALDHFLRAEEDAKKRDPDKLPMIRRQIDRLNRTHGSELTSQPADNET